MAIVDVSRGKGRHKKRDVSVAAYYIDSAELAALIADGALATDQFMLGRLPTNIIILASLTTVLVPFDAVVTMTCGLVGGTGAEFAAALTPLDAAADTVVAGSGDISVQTGPAVQATFAGAPGQVGLALVTVEYIEHEQCTGELTNFVTS